MTLRNQIAANHDKAEKHRFVESLLGQTMPSEAYAAYLFNQYKCYKALEQRAQDLGLLVGVEDVLRADLILQDAQELGADETVYPSTQEYVAYVQTADPLLAHIYVRHFADMYGGQLIKKVAPGSCRMYEFTDRSELLAKIRPMLSDDLGEEANKVFEFVLRIFEEIADAYNIQPVNSSGV